MKTVCLLWSGQSVFMSVVFTRTWDPKLLKCYVIQSHNSNVLCCVVLCCAVLCCVVLCCVVLCCAVLCCAVLCCVVLCCVVLCCAVLCCAVLCCVVLCFLSVHYLVGHASWSYTYNTHVFYMYVCMYGWAESEQQEALCVLRVHRLVNIQEEPELEM